VVALAEERLPLEEFATGPAQVLHAEQGPHVVLWAGLMVLRDFPGVGWRLIRAGLRSPDRQTRKEAARAIGAWPREMWPEDAAAELQQASSKEPDEHLTVLFRRIRAGEPLEEEVHLLKVWDLESGTKLHTLESRPSTRFQALVITPDGKRAVCNSDDNTLSVWDLEHGAEIHTLEGHDAMVTAVVITPDGRHVVSGSGDHMLKVWDMEHGTELRTLEGHSGGVTALAIIPGGRRVISGSYDGALKVWNLERGLELHPLEGYSDAVTAVTITPDGKRVISVSSTRSRYGTWSMGRSSMLEGPLRCRDGRSDHARWQAGDLRFRRLHAQGVGSGAWN
jgi:hypothetical protein